MRFLSVNRALVVTMSLLMVCGSSLAESKLTAAEKTFKKLLYDPIGTLWYASLRQRANELSPGTVRVLLRLSRDGKILHLAILSNTSNNLAAELAVDAIKQAKIPPPPASLLTKGRLESEMIFTIYSN